MWPSLGHSPYKEKSLAAFWEKVCFWQKKKSKRVTNPWPPVFLSLELNDNSLRTKSQQLRAGRIKALRTLIYERWADLETVSLQTFYDESLKSFLRTTLCHVFCYLQLSASWMVTGSFLYFRFTPLSSTGARNWPIFFIAYSLAQKSTLEKYLLNEWANEWMSSNLHWLSTSTEYSPKG